MKNNLKMNQKLDKRTNSIVLSLNEEIIFTEAELLEAEKDLQSHGATKEMMNDEINEQDWDGATFVEQDELLKINPELSQAQEEMEQETPEQELQEYKDDFFGMIVGSLNSIKAHTDAVLANLENPMVKENLTEPFLQSMAALAEDYVLSIHNYVMFNKENESQMQESMASSMFKVGDKVRNMNMACMHYGSEGMVKQIRELPENMGNVIAYECSNSGPNWKQGDMLVKTEAQLKKIM